MSAPTIGRVASLPGRLRRLPALAAALAQLAQAAGSFALQVVAAHALGASGLGTISLCLGTTILTTAVTSGLVGDSLTVLDRHDRRVRAALQAWLVVVTLAGSVGAALVLNLTGVLGGGEAVLFAVATAAFQVEEVLRRVLMAVHALLDPPRRRRRRRRDDAAQPAPRRRDPGGLLPPVGRRRPGGRHPRARSPCCRGAERRLVPLRGAALREVIAFGGWRGAQVALTPTGLTISRFVLLGATGAVALGEVEAGRILGAPALLVVQGLGSYLLSTYARDRALPLETLKARARRASLAMAGTAVALGVVVTALTPFLAPLAVGRSIDVHLVTVAGWALFAAATATMQPFASLAVTRGSQRAVFGLRSLDVVVGTGLLALALGPIGLAAPLTPLVLAVGPVLSGVLVRTVVLRTTGADPVEGQS